MAPENTLAAFQQSILDGADGIEFDVRLARDDVPVVIHDPTLNRTATKEARRELATTRVCELTSSELSQVNVPSTFRNRHYERPTTVPTLQSVFELFAQALGVLYLEMKGEPVNGRLVKKVVNLIQAYSFQERVIVECFDHQALLLLKRLAPEIRTAPLFERGFRSVLRFRSAEQILLRAEQAFADEVALHYKLANQTTIGLLMDRGFQVVIWTVDDPRWVADAERLRIKGVVTNNPAVLLQHRSSTV